MLSIITHCYAIELDFYATLLRYQLASLVHYPPKQPTSITVCCMESDEAVNEVLQDFLPRENLHLAVRYLTRDQISRRSIGRNLAAKASEADLIWFTDCDYVFGPQCIDGLWRAWESLQEWAPMIFPERYHIHKNHSTGDAAIEAGKAEVLPEINADDFFPARFTRPIGGVQICPGSFCREHGYLDQNKKYQRPLEQPFSNFRDDVVFRKFCQHQGQIQAVDFPALYRVRHSRTSY